MIPVNAYCMVELTNQTTHESTSEYTENQQMQKKIMAITTQYNHLAPADSKVPSDNKSAKRI